MLENRFEKTELFFIDTTMRSRLFMGLGFHQVACECHLIYPKLTGKECYRLAKSAYLACVKDDFQSLLEFTSEIGIMVSDGDKYGFRSLFEFGHGGCSLEPWKVAIGLMDMARGYSKKWE